MSSRCCFCCWEKVNYLWAPAIFGYVHMSKKKSLQFKNSLCFPSSSRSQIFEQSVLVTFSFTSGCRGRRNRQLRADRRLMRTSRWEEKRGEQRGARMEELSPYDALLFAGCWGQGEPLEQDQDEAGAEPGRAGGHRREGEEGSTGCCRKKLLSKQI